jgi:hypothetical protein
MSGTNRYTTRRPPVSAHHAALSGPPLQGAPASSPARIEALRKLVQSGQYHVSPRWIATRIFKMAGVKLPE